MKKSVKKLLLIAPAMMLAGALLSGAAFALGARFDAIRNFNLSSPVVRVADAPGYRAWENEYSADGSYALDAAGVASVDLKWLAGYVKIEVYGGDEILFSETALASISKKNALRYGVADGTLYIQYCAPEARGNLPSKTLIVMVPESLAAGMESFSCETSSAYLRGSGFAARSFRFHSASGALDVDSVTADAVSLSASSGGLRFSGTYRILTAQTGSASVVLDSYGAADSTDIETSSGDVFLSGNCGALGVETGSGIVSNAWGLIEGWDFEEWSAPESIKPLAADSLDVRASSGEVRLSGSFNKARVDTASGSVALALDACPDKLEISTSSGGVTLFLPAQSGFTLNFDTSSGKMSCDFSVAVDDNRYVSGDGSADFSVATSSGSLRVKAK